MAEKNIYQKLSDVKLKFVEANIKKSGQNKFAGFSYYELSDIEPTLLKLCNEAGLVYFTTFSQIGIISFAVLRLVDTDKPESFIEISSPMYELELKGCNKVQALGGTETYSRRYLLLAMFSITESDAFDAVSGDKEKKQVLSQKCIEDMTAAKSMVELKEIAGKYKQSELIDPLTELFESLASQFVGK